MGRQSRQEQFRWRNIRINDLVEPAVGLAVLVALVAVDLVDLVAADLVVPEALAVGAVVLVAPVVVPVALVAAMVVIRLRTCTKT